MKNSLQKLDTVSSAESNKMKYSLGCGVRRLRNQQDFIWGNLLTSEWIKIPQITDEFLIACTKKNVSECIKIYGDKTGCQENLFEDLLEYACMKGFLERTPPLNGSIEGVNFLNIFSDITPKVEIDEIYKFESVNLCIRPNKGLKGMCPTPEQWRESFKKFKNSSIKKASIILWEDSEADDIQYYISLLRDCIDSIAVNIVVEKFKSLHNIIAQLAENLCPDKDIVTVRIEADKISSIEELNNYRQQIESGLEASGIKVIFKLGMYLICDNKLMSYFEKEKESLKLYSFSSMCYFNEEYDVRDNLNTELMVENWFKLMKQYSLINYRYSEAETSFNRFKLSCGAGRNSIAIMEDGSVYPCPTMSVIKYKIGSIITDDISEIEINSRKLLSGTCVEKREGCKNCFISYFCGGGCLARAYHTYSDINNVDPFCGLFKAGPGLIPWYFDNELSFKHNLRRLSEKANTMESTNNEKK